LQKIIVFIKSFAKLLSECQTIWISDEAQRRFVGPHPDLFAMVINSLTIAGEELKVKQKFELA